MSASVLNMAHMLGSDEKQSTMRGTGCRSISDKRLRDDVPVLLLVLWNILMLLVSRFRLLVQQPAQLATPKLAKA